MKSLREFIQDTIYMKIGKEKVGIIWNDTNEATGEIIVEIEKRIDSEKEKLLSKQVTDPYDVFEKMGYERGLNKVKEMLCK